MAVLENIYSKMEQFQDKLQLSDLLEARFENNGDFNPIYIGYCVQPNGDPTLPIWFIQKIEYEGEGIVRKRLPDEGIKFSYVWNDREDYFS